MKFKMTWDDGAIALNEEVEFDTSDLKCARHEAEELLNEYNRIEIQRYGKEARLRKLLRIEEVEKK